MWTGTSRACSSKMPGIWNAEANILAERNNSGKNFTDLCRLQSTVEVKHLNGKLSIHFIFKLTADGKVHEGDRIYCVYCHKQFAFRVSNTSLTYHIQHKHPLKYHVVDSDVQKSSQVQSITNFLSCHSNKPVSDKVSADLKVAIAQWIASSGRRRQLRKMMD